MKIGSNEDYARFYAQSWAMCHYFFRAEGQGDKLRTYLQSVADGGDPVETFRTHVEPDLAKFQLQLRRYVASRPTYSLIKRGAQISTKVTITRLGQSADDLLLPLAVLDRLPPGPHPQIAEFVTEVITKAAAQHPGDQLAERALALRALISDERGEAVQRLDALLVRAPDDPALLRWRAAAIGQSTPEGAQEARRYLVRSFKANPNDWRTLYAYALARGVRTQPLSKTDLEVMELAAALAPQVEDITLDLATAYVHAGRLDDAAWALGPLAHAQHGGFLRKMASDLFDKAEAGDTKGFFAVLSARPGTEGEEAEDIGGGR